jgi:hypothetical protein
VCVPQPVWTRCRAEEVPAVAGHGSARHQAFCPQYSHLRHHGGGWLLISVRPTVPEVSDDGAQESFSHADRKIRRSILGATLLFIEMFVRLINVQRCVHQIRWRWAHNCTQLLARCSLLWPHFSQKWNTCAKAAATRRNASHSRLCSDARVATPTATVAHPSLSCYTCHAVVVATGAAHIVVKHSSGRAWITMCPSPASRRRTVRRADQTYRGCAYANVCP